MIIIIIKPSQGPPVAPRLTRAGPGPRACDKYTPMETAQNKTKNKRLKKAYHAELIAKLTKPEHYRRYASMLVGK